MKRTWGRVSLLVVALVLLAALFVPMTTFAEVDNAVKLVTYSAGTGTGKVPDSHEFVQGEDVTVKFDPLPTMEKNEFVGWTYNGKTYTTTDNIIKTTATNDDIKLVAAFKRSGYTVTYDLNGGTGTVPEDKTLYKTGNFVTVLYSDPAPKKGTAVFVGWDTNKSATDATYTKGGTRTGFAMQAADVTLYAVYKDTFKVTYENATGGTGEVPKDAKAYFAGDKVTVQFSPLPTKLDAEFKHWVDKNDTTKTYAMPKAGEDPKTFLIAADTTLVAVFNDIKWELSYDPNFGGYWGGVTPPATKKYAPSEMPADVQFAAIPTKGTGNAYTFLGWDKTRNATDPEFKLLGGKTKITLDKDTTLYAIYKENTYTLTYNINGGTGSVPSDSTQYKSGGKAKVLFTPVPTKVGFDFLGWHTAPKLGTATAPTYPADGKEYTHTVAEGADTLYAIYKKSVYTVTYVAGSGSGTPPTDDTEYTKDAVVTVSFDASKLVPPADPANQEFVGWATDDKATEPLYTKDGTTSFKITKDTVLRAIYKVKAAPTTFTVTYKLNGGVGSVPVDSTKYKTNDAAQVLFTPVPSKLPNVAFVGWSTDPTSTEANAMYKPTGTDNYINMTADVTLYAVYKDTTADYWTVTYALNGGDGKVPEDTTKYPTNTEVKVLFDPAPTRTDTDANYTFVGWAEDANATAPVYKADGTKTFKITKSTTLYAIYQKSAKTYTVKYDINGGAGAVPEDKNAYEKGATLTVKFTPAPTKVGYTFVGWDTNKKCVPANVKYTAGGQTQDNVEGDMTLYAIYKDATVDTFTVTYTLNGGTGSVPTDSNNYKAGDKVTVAFTPAPAKDGYVFVGWKGSDASSTIFMPSGPVSFNIAENMTLAAHYVSNAMLYTVTYDANGGTGSVPTDSKQYVLKSEVEVLFTPAPVKDGATFLGWSENKAATAPTYKADGTTKFAIVSNTKLYAIYKDTPLAVTYDANGGTGEVPTDAKKYAAKDEVTVLFTPAPAKDGFTFAGWAKAKDATAPEFTATGAKTFKIAEDTKLYAIYNPIIYTVSYDANGGTGAVPADAPQYANATATVAFSPAPTKEGFVFAGWAKDKAATAPEFTAKGVTTFKITADTKLYAIYEKGSTFVAVTDITGIPAKITVDDDITLKGEVTPDNATNKKIVWTVSPANKLETVTVIDGVFLAHKAGTATIRATIAKGAAEDKDFVKDFEITVRDKVATSITLNKEAITLKPKEAFKLVATIAWKGQKKSQSKMMEYNADEELTALDENASFITWTTSNAKVATVSISGRVKAVKAGTATITATTANGLTAKCVVTVPAAEPTSIKLNKKKITLKVGEEFTLKATLKPAGATAKIKWVSSAKKIASVETKYGMTNVITAKKAGTATITITFKDLSYECVVTVKE